jgi:hypothetical protein
VENLGLEISESEFLPQFFREKKQARAIFWKIPEQFGGNSDESLKLWKLGNALAFALLFSQN